MVVVDVSRELVYAAQVGDCQGVVRAIKGGAGVDSVLLGYTALQHAAKNGHTEVVSELLAAGANPGLVNHLGNSALHLAIEAGWTDVAHVLLERGAKINMRNRAGETPLDIAMQFHPRHKQAARVR